MLFPFAPAFAKNVPLTSAFIMPLRSSLSRGSGTLPSVPANCTVPQFIGLKKNATASLWSGAGFIGTLSVGGSGGSNSVIGSQELPSGTVVPCTTSMSISN